MILFIPTNHWNYHGASEYLWQRTSLELLKEGVPVGVCLHDFGPLSGDLEEMRRCGGLFHFRKVHDPFEAGRKERFRPFKKVLKLWQTPLPGRAETLAWVKKQRPALVVVNQCSNSDGAWWMAELAAHGIPLATITNSGGAEIWPSDEELGQLSAGMMASRINYFNSPHNQYWMETQVGHPVPNVRFTFCPHQMEYHPQCEWPEDEGIFRFAMIGRLDPKSKGHELAFKIMNREEWRQRPVELNVYGDGPHGRALVRMAEYLKLDKVRFKGPTRDIVGVWRENHCLLQPSRYEGLPCTLIEAMLCGRAAVIPNVGIVPQLMEDGIHGFVAAYPTVESIGDAMERCWKQRQKIRETGMEARRRVLACVPEKPELLLVQDIKKHTGYT